MITYNPKLFHSYYLIHVSFRSPNVLLCSPSQLFRNGQRLLEKQRFQFPPSWLYIDNIEGEWGAFSDIMKRKDTAIQQQVANLQMKIVQEDRAVEGRTTDLLTDWEKAKPVAVSSPYIFQSQRSSFEVNINHCDPLAL